MPLIAIAYKPAHHIVRRYTSNELLRQKRLASSRKQIRVPAPNEYSVTPSHISPAGKLGSDVINPPRIE